MRAYNLERFIREIDMWGVSDVLLPFMLIFILMYGIAQKSKVISENKGLNIGFAAVMAAIPVTLHVTHVIPTRYDPIEIIKEAIPGVAIVVIAMMMLVLFFGIFGGKTDNFNYGAIGVWSFGIIAIFVGNSVWGDFLYFPFILTTVVAIIVIVSLFKVGLPSWYDIVVIFSTCIIVYFFGRRIGWFDYEPRWINDWNFSGFFWVIVIMGVIIGVAVSGDKEEISEE